MGRNSSWPLGRHFQECKKFAECKRRQSWPNTFERQALQAPQARQADALVLTLTVKELRAKCSRRRNQLRLARALEPRRKARRRRLHWPVAALLEGLENANLGWLRRAQKAILQARANFLGRPQRVFSIVLQVSRRRRTLLGANAAPPPPLVVLPRRRRRSFCRLVPRVRSACRNSQQQQKRKQQQPPPPISYSKLRFGSTSSTSSSQGAKPNLIGPQCLATTRPPSRNIMPSK